uniref:Uncharacterized protein n=1 Tax=Schimmelmannia schousboei TaxID=173468 RepID=A0A1C9C8X0_9FLOR|nr:hypothetical protein Schim_143 [Schimmelmannia schousboei]AOM64824.1 hypothetical protein Schim_143 [Schimmelmannia schousboei]
MDLLLISIEALDIYTFEQNFSSMRQFTHNEIFIIRSGNLIRHPDHNSLLKFNYIIILLYAVYRLINTQFIQNTAVHILNNYYLNNSTELTQQYINKFTYIHNRTQNYYNKNSYYDNLDLIEMAMINLYVISKMTYKTSLYFLIKYLYS